MKIRLLSVLLLFGTIGFGQSITNETIASGFSSTLKNNVHLSSSIGEAGPVQYLIKSSVNLTQGYLQVENKGKISIVNAQKNELISLYPNPAIDIVYIDLLEYRHENIQVSILNTLGQEVKKFNPNLLNQQVLKLDIRELASSEYICLIQLISQPDSPMTIKFHKK